MLKFSIDVDKTTINEFKKNVLGIEDTIKSGLLKAALFTESEAKQSFNTAGKPNVVTGRLRSSIRSGVQGLTMWLGSNVSYAPTQEFGAKITPKSGKYLKFKIQGQWKTVKEVVIPARPFIAPAVVDNLDKIGDIIKNEILEALG